MLGHHHLCLYIVGSLAVGDFNPSDSDIEEPLVQRLQEIHEKFAEGSSPWAKKLEAVDVPQDVLRSQKLTSGLYPQLEKGTALFSVPLEPGWVFSGRYVSVGL